jgi:hypothetical protein
MEFTSLPFALSSAEGSTYCADRDVAQMSDKRINFIFFIILIEQSL